MDLRFREGDEAADSEPGGGPESVRNADEPKENEKGEKV